MSLNIDKEQVREIYQLAPMGISGHTLVFLATLSFLIGNVSTTLLAVWASFMVVVLLLRALSVVIYRRSKGDTNQDNWVMTYQVGSFLTSILWGSVSLLFADQFSPADLHFIMMAIAFGLAGAGVATIGMIFRVYASFVIPLISMIVFDLLETSSFVNTIAGGLCVFGLFFLLASSFKHSKRSNELIKRKKEVELTQLDIIEHLSKASEYRDEDTGLHIKRMSYSSYLLAQAYGLSKKEAELILMASPMHDIGKIGIPDSILLKPGKLSEEEWEVMKTHTLIGAKILDDSDCKLLKIASRIAKSHHERWDGSGYPYGLSKSDIPIEARIVTICDVFDALTSKRPYKKVWSENDALNYIKGESGKYFDPKLVDIFISISDKIIASNHKYIGTA